jgi:DNA polymerase-1
MTKVLIDGDVLAYRAAFAKESVDEESAKKTIRDLVNQCLGDTLTFPRKEDYIVYLTGSGNFRYNIAVTHVYKGNRKETPKPEFLGVVRHVLIYEFDAIISEGEEADDLIGIAATKYGRTSIVVTTDKDMKQLNCVHYNPTTRETFYQDGKDADFAFYTQLLTGDTVDNIKCLKGIGPAKASKLLAECQSVEDLYVTCQKAYEDAGEPPERLLENARLLWLRREVGQMWEPPL